MLEEKTNTFQQTVVTAHTLHDFIFMIVDLLGEGWEFVDDSPPTTYGFMYECALTRNPTQKQLDTDLARSSKKTRSEILAIARAAKAAKANNASEELPDHLATLSNDVLPLDTQTTGA